MRSFKMRWLTVLLFAISLLAVAALSPIASAGSTYQVSTDATGFQANGADLPISGVNDQTVVIYAMYPYPTYDYRYSNHLFSSVGLGYIGDPLTKITSDNYTHFWWQYFYEVKALGLNCVRLGGFDDWGLSMLHKVWRTNQTLWHSVIDPMFEMANETGVYLIFCFGGDYTGARRFSETAYTFGTSVANPTTGSIFLTGSETYTEFVNFVGEVMTNYTNRTSLLAWEALNEPNSDNGYNVYWLPTYVTNTAARAAFASWSTSLSAALIAKDHHHLVTNGVGMGLFFGWGQSNFNQYNAGTWDCVSNHVYASINITWTGQDYLIDDPMAWAEALGKPLLVSELAYNEMYPPWEYGYWPSYEMVADDRGLDYVWMCLNGCPNSTGGGPPTWFEQTPVPAYPGYPPSAVTMAAIPGIPASYWSNMTVIAPETPIEVPDVPDPLPDPHILPPEVDAGVRSTESWEVPGGGSTPSPHSPGNGGGSYYVPTGSTGPSVATPSSGILIVGAIVGLGIIGAIVIAAQGGGRPAQRRRRH